MLTEQLAQMPLADIHIIRHTGQTDALRTMGAHIVQRRIHNEAAGLAAFLYGLRFSGRCFFFLFAFADPLCHGADRLVQLLHFAGLEQIPADAQVQRLPRILKIPASSFLTVSVVVLIPGRGLYYTLYHAIAGNSARASQFGIDTTGIVFTSICAKLFTNLKKGRN